MNQTSPTTNRAEAKPARASPFSAADADSPPMSVEGQETPESKDHGTTVGNKPQSLPRTP